MYPYRSVLYLPGSNARALDKASGLAADALIFDLEDAVAPDKKVEARAQVAACMTRGGFGPRRVLIRINALDTPWGHDDLEAVMALRPHGVLLPKVGRVADIEVVAGLLTASDPDHPTRIWAMIETPDGVLNAAALAVAPGMAGFVLGTNDLLKDLGARSVATRQPLATALSLSLLAARAAGIICIDGVYNAFRDVEGLEAECLQGRDLGFDGKSLIHPAQLEVANRIFAPGADELALARAQVDAFAAAQARGEGVAVLDGRIVENLHVETAAATLAKAAAIAELGGEGG